MGLADRVQAIAEWVRREPCGLKHRPVIEMYLSEMGDWNVGSIAQFQVSDEADYCNATTLPNALADLWCELKEGKCL